jgi:aconitate hydratase 2/2-methylisocitrate dehydratase
MLKVKGESLLSSTPVVVLSTILGRTPTMDEYKAAVKINLTQFYHLINY